MTQESLPTRPLPTDSLSGWEQYLSDCLTQVPTCRVRVSKMAETPAAREQLFLRRLTDLAHTSFAHTALADSLPAMQKQALGLIQLRRRWLPDDSPAWTRGDIFVVATELHQAVRQLLEQMEVYRNHYSLLKPLAEHWSELTAQFLSGALREPDSVQNLVQQSRQLAADQAIVPAIWLHLASTYAATESGLARKSQQAALANGLLSACVAARMLKQDQRLMDADAVLVAALFKDLAWLIPHAAETQLARGLHAEWSAGLVGQCPLLSVHVPRLIRQHHEALDGSGLPFGMRAAQFRRDARLLTLVTRWSELYLGMFDSSLDGPLQATAAIQLPGEILVEECVRGRWDSEMCALLFEQLNLPVPESLTGRRAASPPSLNANPHWKVPRPHFAKKSFPILPAQRSQNSSGSASN